MHPVLVALLVVMKLLVVQEVRKGDQETILVFEGGNKAALLKSDPGYESFLRLAERSRDRQIPVGVSVETPEKPETPDKPAKPAEDAPAKPSHIVEIVRASRDVVLELLHSQKDNDLYRVRLQTHDGILTLRVDHAEFRRISELLTESIKNKTPIWFVAKPDFTLLDAIAVPPAKPAGASPAPLPPPGDEKK